MFLEIAGRYWISRFRNRGAAGRSVLTGRPPESEFGGAVGLTVNSFAFGESLPRTVNLRPLMGSFELQFVSDVSVHNPESEPERRVELFSARASLRNSEGTEYR